MLPHSISKLLLTGVCVMASVPAAAAACTDLARLAMDTVAITQAESREAGTFEQELGPEVSLPAHCRVAAVLSPTDDSHIEMELWLPEDWNGRFLALGNGGWAGNISFGAMARGLQSGYAVASNDTGHKGGSAAFAVGHPEKVVDFAWRAMHEMAVHSKRMIEAYYEQPPTQSFYQGCSTGGRQGLIEAQRFPADFDAIIVGAPVNNQLTLNATQLHNMKRLIENRALALSPAKVQLLHDAVLAACEADDGVEDGILNDPLACDFDPESLQCDGGDGAACLTAAEVSAVEDVYAGVHSSDGELIYPGHAKGFELGWRIPEAGSEPTALQIDATRYLVYEDPDWNWREFELERDLALARDKAGYIEALGADLGEFKARGGKLLIYHGWNDPGPSPLNSIGYYDEVLATMGPDQDDWLRLYLMPGMGHCRGGIGPDQADFLGAVEAWIESGSAPDRITASRIREGQVDMTRPLCPYPEVAAWDGEGNPDDAASYTCRATPAAQAQERQRTPDATSVAPGTGR
ncbi:MAG: tannase/feruloyl esterase family alpha/beta hydrolase [Gammaproteobacteria bacterium]|nr:tannase/feruloyl esterase family alpha/beta hydrolase [Gammaproteobacteria bacterium]